MARALLAVLALSALAVTGCTDKTTGNPLPSGLTSAHGTSDLVFDNTVVEAGVTKILVEKYSIDASNVQCPANQEVKVNTTFQCAVTVSGQPKKVTIKVISDAGEYEVGQPT